MSDAAKNAVAGRGGSRSRVKREKKGLHFSSPKLLRAWLTGSSAGQEILGEIEAERCRQCTERPAVLVVLHSDGWVEAYADSAAVKIVQRLHAETPEEGRAVDEYLDQTLPLRFRELYWPNKQAAGRLVERRTIQQEAARLADLITIRDLQEFGRERKADAKRT